MDKESLNVIKFGSQGNPILLLHGWGQTLQSLQPLGELLAREAQVHLIDLPGFGKSAPPPQDWGSLDYAERILQYIDEQGLERVDLLGHSLGGRISIRLGSRYPDRVRSIVLINSAGLQRQRTIRQQIRTQYIKSLRKVLEVIPVYRERLKSWHSDRFGSRDYKNAGILRGTLVKTVNEDLAEDASNIKAPTLLIWGELDTETPIEMGRRYNQIISNSKLISLPGRDHFLFQGEGSHLCAYYVKKFLQDIAEANSSFEKQLSHV